MRTTDPQPAAAAIAVPMLLPYPHHFLAAYVVTLGKVFEIMHELTLETMTLSRRSTEFWLMRSQVYRDELSAMTPWEARLFAGPEDEAQSPPSPRQDAEAQEGSTDAHEDDDGPCCGDACTSKTCARALKSLELALSDFH